MDVDGFRPGTSRPDQILMIVQPTAAKGTASRAHPSLRTVRVVRE
ncbi:hypothetical protein [Arthrobacter sp. NPDC058192]